MKIVKKGLLQIRFGRFEAVEKFSRWCGVFIRPRRGRAMGDAGPQEVDIVIDAQPSSGTPNRLRQRVNVEEVSSTATPPKLRIGPSRVHSGVTEEVHKTPVLASVLSGLICGLIFYVFAALFAAMIFDEAGANIPEYQSLGVGMNTLSAFVGGLIFARLSGCRAVMAGPDITPTVFMVEAAKQISESLCPDGTYEGECDPVERDKILPTLLVAIWLFTAMSGAVFLCLGTFRLTSIVGYMPANVTSGFLSCIGYKVMYYAVEVSPLTRPHTRGRFGSSSLCTAFHPRPRD